MKRENVAFILEGNTLPYVVKIVSSTSFVEIFIIFGNELLHILNGQYTGITSCHHLDTIS